jgi:hypothetical protein
MGRALTHLGLFTDSESQTVTPNSKPALLASTLSFLTHARSVASILFGSSLHASYLGGSHKRYNRWLLRGLWNWLPDNLPSRGSLATRSKLFKLYSPPWCQKCPSRYGQVIWYPIFYLSDLSNRHVACWEVCKWLGTVVAHLKFMVWAERQQWT